MKILVVAPDIPYPPNHGGRADVFVSIKNLHRLGFQIDLICTVKNRIDPTSYEELYNFCENITLVERTESIFDLFSILPFQVKSRSVLSNIKLTENYDVLYLHTEYVGSIIKNLTLKARKKWIRIQNNESKYFLKLSKSTNKFRSKLVFFFDSLKFMFFSAKLLPIFDKQLFISSDEFLKYNKISSNWLPPAVDMDLIPFSNLKERTVLFIGSLFMPNNLEGILWYLNKVHPYFLKYPDYKLIIAGNTLGQNLMNFSQYESVEFYDSPPNLDIFYRQSKVFIAPMFNGAGVKMKVIHAILKGLPVVATKVSIEGTGLESPKHILCDDSIDTFCQNLDYLLNSTESCINLVKKSQEFISENYDHLRIYNRLIAEIY